jgi:hypothetical protein
MVNRHDALYVNAREWIALRILRPGNLLHFTKYLMLEAARNYPLDTGLEKKAHVEGVFEDLLEDSILSVHIRKKDKIRLAYNKLLGSWIDTGIKAHKQRFDFRAPEVNAPTEATRDVVAYIGDVAEQWFKNKIVTVGNVILGITVIMQAAGKFFDGDGDTKRNMVVSSIQEIVHREATHMAPEDRDAILMAIDTFGTPVVDFLVDLSSGQFDFKGMIEQIKASCMPLSSCCKPVIDQSPTILTSDEATAL